MPPTTSSSSTAATVAEPTAPAKPARSCAATVVAAGTTDKNNDDVAATTDGLRFAEYEGSVQFRCSAPNANGRGIGGNAHNGTSPNMELKRKSEQLRPSASLRLTAAPISATTVLGNIYANTQLLGAASDDPAADEADGDVELRTAAGDTSEPCAAPRRKFHSKSFSMSENQIMASIGMGSVGGGGGGGGGLNLFHQNRELWEKRAELQSQQCLTSQRILSRHRIAAPDLVMDLPYPADGVDGGPGQQQTGGAAIGASSIDSTTGNDVDGDEDGVDGGGVLLLRDDSVDSIDQLSTAAERFASANQCTLKKNERFSGDGCDAAALLMQHHHHPVPTTEQLMAGVDGGLLDDVRLHIDETTTGTAPVAAASLKPDTEPMYADVRKSPIPAQITKKFVTKFADLHLTGGCATAAAAAAATTECGAGVGGVASANGTNGTKAEAPAASATTAATAAFSSFKPAVKAKPPLLKKPLVAVLPPGTPEMGRRHEE